MEGGGGFPKYVNLHKHPLVPPPLTAIGRFLQGQSRQNHVSDHHSNFHENNKGTSFIPSNGVCRFSSSYSNECEEASLVPMNNVFGVDHHHDGVFSKEYQNIQLQYNEIIKSGKKMKSKVCGRKSLIIKGKWTDEEDRKLFGLVTQQGDRKWSNIAEQMIGRAGKQCRERWHNHLRPDIKKDTWSEDEERMLVEAHRKVGNKWAEIAKVIPGRTENAIKNHWNATKRKQNSSRKNKKSEAKRTSCSSILQDYIKSKTNTSTTSDHKVTSNTTTTTNPSTTQGTSSTTISSDNPSIKSNFLLTQLPNLNSDDSPSLDLSTQSYDEELVFMQNFFSDCNTHKKDSNTTSNESSAYANNPISYLHTNSLGFISGNSQYGFASNQIINPQLGLSGNSSSQYGFVSSSSISDDDQNSSLYMKEEDSSKSQLTSDVYISYLLEGATQRDLVMFDAEESADFASASASSDGKKEMDLVEMVFSSQCRTNLQI